MEVVVSFLWGVFFHFSTFYICYIPTGGMDCFVWSLMKQLGVKGLTVPFVFFACPTGFGRQRPSIYCTLRCTSPQGPTLIPTPARSN